MHTPFPRNSILLLSSLLFSLPGLAWPQSDEGATPSGMKHYVQSMIGLRAARNKDSRFYMLGPAAKDSFDQGKDADAKSFAEELGRLAPAYKKNWNYGNAVQDSNLVLGRLALKAGDVEAARSRLLAAGRSPGSPQMDTFGPNMSLARDLLLKGEKDIVLEYFKLCRIFWKMGGDDLNTWKKDVRAGRLPDFGANLIY